MSISVVNTYAPASQGNVSVADRTITAAAAGRTYVIYVWLNIAAGQSISSVILGTSGAKNFTFLGAVTNTSQCMVAAYAYRVQPGDTETNIRVTLSAAARTITAAHDLNGVDPAFTAQVGTPQTRTNATKMDSGALASNTLVPSMEVALFVARQGVAMSDDLTNAVPAAPPETLWVTSYATTGSGTNHVAGGLQIIIKGAAITGAKGAAQWGATGQQSGAIGIELLAAGGSLPSVTAAGSASGTHASSLTVGGTHVFPTVTAAGHATTSASALTLATFVGHALPTVVSAGVARTAGGELSVKSYFSAGRAGKHVGTPVPPPPADRIVKPWSFVLADTRTLRPIGEFTQARNRKLTMALNRPGSCSFDISMNEALAGEILPLETCILALRDGVVRWSGPVWTTDESLPGRSVSVSAVGWKTLLDYRSLKTTGLFPLTYDLRWQFDDTTTDPVTGIVLSSRGNIAAQIVTRMNQQFQSPITVDKIDPDLLTINWTYGYYSFKPVGGEIDQLSQIESGFDWEINPVTRQISFYSAITTDPPLEVVFGYGWGPHNLSAVRRTRDPSKLVNWMLARGDSGAAALVGESEPDAIVSQDRYGMFQEAPTLSGVVDPQVLLAYAGEELLLRDQPQILFDITPKPWGPDVPVPRVFDDYNLGDIAKLMIRQGTIQMSEPQVFRIFGFTISPDDDGVERVSSIQMTASNL